MTPKPLRWSIYKKEGDEYPYTLYIEEKPGQFIILKAREKWPGPGKNVFCKFEGVVTGTDFPKDERADFAYIVSLRHYGKRLTVVLDRPRNKRCWFIFVQKEYKKQPGLFYTQVFWITQSSSVAERRGAYIPRTRGGGYTVVIDSTERYPYSFGAVPIERRKLAVGDYGLMVNGAIIAAVERKTKENFFHEPPHLDVFRSTLHELDKFSHKAVAIEASYSDLVSPKNAFYSGTFVARTIADLCAEFPNIPFLFFKGRKSANQWVYYYFQQIHARGSR